VHEFRALVSDLDGTLLDPAGQLTPRTEAALRRARWHGWKLALATARPARLVTEALGVHIDLFDALLVSNGAAVFAVSDERFTVEVPIAQDSATEIVQCLRAAWPGCGCGWEVGQRFEHDRAFEEIAARRRIIRHLDGEAVTRPAGPVHQIVMATPGEHGAEMLDEVAALVGPGITVTDSAGGVVELSAEGADKASALHAWAGAAGFDMTQVLAFGDGMNDLTMLAAAGYSVAMANAPAEVRAAARAVTGSNSEDGVAAVLESLLGFSAPGCGAR